jgi:hypothetical protein
MSNDGDRSKTTALGKKAQSLRALRSLLASCEFAGMRAIAGDCCARLSREKKNPARWVSSERGQLWGRAHAQRAFKVSAPAPGPKMKI